MRHTIAGICPKHGFFRGEECNECDKRISEQAPYTNKDKLYDFYSISLGTKIESKTQWKRELKKRGLTDDFNQGWSGRKRDLDVAIPKQHSRVVHNHEAIKNQVRDILKERGLYSADKLFKRR